MKLNYFTNHKQRAIKLKRANNVVNILSPSEQQRTTTSATVPVDNRLRWKNDGCYELSGKYWRYYCENTSVHGIKYITKPKLHWIERLTWLIFVSLATFCVIYVSILVSEQYNSSPLSTVVETTHFPISEIPFPAVSLCNTNRINWMKVNEAYRTFIPIVAQTNRTIITFMQLMKCLNKLDFGSFDEFAAILNSDGDLSFMENINVTRILEFLMFTPLDLMLECWWRNRYYNCSDLFAKQKTEYGFCISFNSLSSYGAPLTHKNMSYFPWRTHTNGLWSALRVIVNLTQQPENNAENPPGINVIIHHPAEWPNIANFIPGYTATTVSINPTTFYTSPDVERYTPFQRQCVYSNEVAHYNVMTLTGLPYQRANCMAECRQRYMLKFCNCTVDFFYQSGVYPPCNIKGLLCMYRYNDVFNFEKPLELNEYFDDQEEGIVCPCLPECARIAYEVEIQPNLLNEDSTHTKMDIHFNSATMVKYRTDVAYGWMDLLVAFGGIVGLFLGCSLLSGVEIIYYLTIGFYWFAKRHRRGGSVHGTGQLKTENMLMVEWNRSFATKLNKNK